MKYTHGTWSRKHRSRTPPTHRPFEGQKYGTTTRVETEKIQRTRKINTRWERKNHGEIQIREEHTPWEDRTRIARSRRPGRVREHTETFPLGGKAWWRNPPIDSHYPGTDSRTPHDCGRDSLGMHDKEKLGRRARNPRQTKAVAPGWPD